MDQNYVILCFIIIFYRYTLDILEMKFVSLA